MNYIFKGKLWDKTEDSLEPISNVMIKLYTTPKADKNGIMRSDLIAESATDSNGNFVIEINDEKTEIEEMKIDILCEKLPETTLPADSYSKINFKSLSINPGRAKLKMESFKVGTITFLSIFSAA